MRIMHLCLSCFYIDDFNYQENILPRINKQDGHEVLLVASTETYLEDKTLGYVRPGFYFNGDGIKIVRLAYRKFLPHFAGKKIRSHKGLTRILYQFKPDVILFHGLCGWELATVARFKKNNPEVKFYTDSHEDANNSARSIVSRLFLHKIFYRAVVGNALPYIDKVLYVSLETKYFIKRMYGVPETLMEFYPLGGEVYSDQEYYEKRNRIRTLLGLTKEDIMIVQAGKMNIKKKVLQSMQDFSSLDNEKLKLFIIGSVDKEIYSIFYKFLKNNSRINYVGWKNPSELMEFLCAADVYLQPGSQSAILQNALCLRCPVIVDDVPSHIPYVNGNGWLVSEKKPLLNILNNISVNPFILNEMSLKSLSIAKDILDYRKLASRLYR